MKRRLFIAINLPDSLKNRINAELEKIRNDFTDDVRFLGRENWHVTVTFLDYQSNEAMDSITSAMHLTGADQQKLEINFENITYGPQGGPPRMLWLNGTRSTSDQLGDFKFDLEDKLIDEGIHFKRETRRFHSHITLARFHTRLNLPKIEIPFPFGFQAESLDLMESHLSSKGADYEILQRVPFEV